jgi:hypothetical protein
MAMKDAVVYVNQSEHASASTRLKSSGVVSTASLRSSCRSTRFADLCILSQDVSAAAMVAGAFDHPRLWEKLKGGVTRDLLARMSLPLLMLY